MVEDRSRRGDRVAEIEDQIQQALGDIGKIRTGSSKLMSPTDLEEAEIEIVRATDKLASLLTGLKIQQAVDSDELKQKEKELLESMPARMKNQGRRRVGIQTTRGEPVTIEAPYFSPNKKKSERKKRKKKR